MLKAFLGQGRARGSGRVRYRFSPAPRFGKRRTGPMSGWVRPGRPIRPHMARGCHGAHHGGNNSPGPEAWAGARGNGWAGLNCPGTAGPGRLGTSLSERHARERWKSVEFALNPGAAWCYLPASGGYDVMVACQLPKLNARVRFPLPAPIPPFPLIAIVCTCCRYLVSVRGSGDFACFSGAYRLQHEKTSQFKKFTV